MDRWIWKQVIHVKIEIFCRLIRQYTSRFRNQTRFICYNQHFHLNFWSSRLLIRLVRNNRWGVIKQHNVNSTNSISRFPTSSSKYSLRFIYQIKFLYTMKFTIRIVNCCVWAIHINSVMILEIFECSRSNLIKVKEYPTEVPIVRRNIINC